jgi:tetratricopeptide (TPR) repeat protein
MTVEAAESPALALYNRGVDLLAAGELADAGDCFEQALALDPRLVAATYNLAAIRHRQGRFDEAVALNWQTIAMAPAFTGAHSNLAIALRALGRSQEALACFRRAADLAPADPDVLLQLGDIQRELRRSQEAADTYRRTIELRPDEGGALFGLGTALLEMRRFDEALEPLTEAIRLRHDFAEAYLNRSVALREMGRVDEAVRDAEIGVALKPEGPRAQMALGDALYDLGNFPAAAAAYAKACAPGPDHATARHKLGVAYTQLGRLEEAVFELEQSLAELPDDPLCMTHLANAVAKLRQYDRALGLYRRALERNPTLDLAWANLGVVLHELACFDDAIECYAEARSLAEDGALADYNESATRLIRGEYEAGWRLYEARALTGPLSRKRWNVPRPQWVGKEPIEGHAILVHAEQGMGDTIQFCRYLPLLADRGARVLAALPGPILDLVAAMDRRIEIVTEENMPPFDFHSPMMSLPHALGTVLETVPARVPYLFAPAERKAHWARTLSPRRGRRVGLAWAGNPRHTNDRQRSMPLATLLPLLDLPGIQFISLQKEIKEEDRAVYQAAENLLKLGETLTDYGDTAALLDELDLVIAVDTSVAHLAGALGRPFWVLVTHIPEWRWLLDRDDSPWYPTARVVRQKVDGDWDEVIARIARELAVATTPRQS